MPNPITRLDIASLIETLEGAARNFRHAEASSDGMGQEFLREGRRGLDSALKQLRYAQMESAT